MVTRTEERITEDNWNLTAKGKSVRHLCALLKHSVDQRASLDEVARLAWDIHSQVERIIEMCDTEAE